MEKQIKRLIILSVLEAFLLCIPCGAGALGFTLLAKRANANGDTQSAEQGVKRAKITLEIGVVVGLLAILFLLAQ